MFGPSNAQGKDCWQGLAVRQTIKSRKEKMLMKNPAETWSVARNLTIIPCSTYLEKVEIFKELLSTSNIKLSGAVPAC